jgi:hypothetical protein
MQILLLQSDGSSFMGGLAWFVIVAILLAGAFILFALVSLWQSSASGAAKLLWTALIIFLPLLGSILWFLIGNKQTTVVD